jgi:hypothetical protein
MRLMLTHEPLSLILATLTSRLAYNSSRAVSPLVNPISIALQSLRMCTLRLTRMVLAFHLEFNGMVNQYSSHLRNHQSIQPVSVNGPGTLLAFTIHRLSHRCHSRAHMKLTKVFVVRHHASLRLDKSLQDNTRTLQDRRL